MAAGRGRNALMEILTNNNIQHKVIEHPAVFTVDEMMKHLTGIEDGLVTKNLFLKDKKKKLWLLTAVHSKEVKLAEVAKTVGAPGGLRFADEAIMIEKLGVAQGCATPLAIFNDSNNDVRLIVDSDLLAENRMVYSHPMENTATLGMTSSDFKKFIESTKHEPITIELA
ncbi:prolyl-tRNA synthetase associated domain-containing protein 1-like [Clytia hemisphaerica]|uniref:prolyl-tRNA synthetase associated domain-containing protein 1-like n=1 Tax=Clytia hemisphaerica TaxID=252671 RepID=UPI0034D63CF0